jgi:hypothetical protein
MFYSLLGRVAWFAATRYLRRRYGRAYVPKPLLAGGVVASLLAIVRAGQRSSSS